MLGAGRIQASLIAYAGWEVLGIYLEVKGKANLHPEFIVLSEVILTKGYTAREVNISGNKYEEKVKTY